MATPQGCVVCPVSNETHEEQPLFVYLRELGRPRVLHGLPEPGARLADPAVAEVLVLLALRLLLLLLQVALIQKQRKNDGILSGNGRKRLHSLSQ